MLKTRSAVKKRVKITGTGKVILAQANKRHLLSDKSKKSKGKNKYGLVIDRSEMKRIKEQLPYSF
jgi:large subunit ribosomal protein L35